MLSDLHRHHPGIRYRYKYVGKTLVLKVKLTNSVHRMSVFHPHSWEAEGRGGAL